MFDNSLDLQGTFPSVSLAGQSDGRTVRKVNLGGGSFYELIIGNQETGENKGIITDRYLVQTNYILTDEVTKKPVRSSAQIVMSYPRHASIGNTLMQQLLLGLVSFFTSTLDTTQINTLNAQTARVFNGEL